jgi:hypothetical protein
MDALLSANSGNLPSDPNQDHFLNFTSPKTFSLPGAFHPFPRNSSSMFLSNFLWRRMALHTLE